ncbi:hypothetical protein [Amycolatopsis sp. NPDC058986]
MPPFTAVRDSTAPTGSLTVSHHAWCVPHRPRYR